MFEDVKISKISKNYFNKIVGKLDVNRNLECVRDSFTEILFSYQLRNIIIILVLKTLKA